MLRKDIQKTYDLVPGGRLRKIIGCYRSPGVHAVITFRFGQWLLSQPLLNSLIMLALLLSFGILAMMVFCLSSGGCSIQDRIEQAHYRNRPVMVESLKMVRNLGVNPKRQRNQAHSGSA